MEVLHICNNDVEHMLFYEKWPHKLIIEIIVSNSVIQEENFKNIQKVMKAESA